MKANRIVVMKNQFIVQILSSNFTSFFFKTQYYNKILIIAIQRERFEQPITDHRQRKCMLDFLLTFYSPVILDFNNKTFTSDFFGEKNFTKWLLFQLYSHRVEVDYISPVISHVSYFLENNQRLCSTLDEAKGSCDVVRVISPPAYAKSFKLLDN